MIDIKFRFTWDESKLELWKVPKYYEEDCRLEIKAFTERCPQEQTFISAGKQLCCNLSIKESISWEQLRVKDSGF